MTHVTSTVTPMIEPNQDAMRAHLEHLFGGDIGGGHDGRIEIAWTDAADGKLRHGAIFGTDQIEEAIEHAVMVNRVPQQNVYVGAALRNPGVAPFGRGADVDFYALTTLYVDIDDDVLAQARDHYRHRGCPPTAVVVTGRQPHIRVQLLWRLEEPERDPQATRAQLRALADALGGDVTVVNPSRVLRLAGSIAWPVKPGRVLEHTEWQQPNDGRPKAYMWGQIARAFPVAPSTTTTTNNNNELDPNPAAPSTTSGGLNIDLGVRVDDYLSAARTGKQWHNHVLGLVAHWVSRGWSDAEILGQAAGLTLAGYTVAQTVADMRTMIQGARVKWNTPDPEIKVEEAGVSGQAPGDLVATPFTSLDAKRIPRREWIYGHHLIRGYISATVSPGGVGKSTLALTEAIAIATGRNLLGDEPHVSGPVWHYNLEDPLDELQRRAVAICMKFGITEAEIAGKLFLNSARDRRLIVATKLRDSMVATPDADAMIKVIKAHGIVATQVDPFVRVHYADENDNKQVDKVADIFAQIAHETRSALDLSHHSRKLGNNDTATPGDMNQARGAGSLVAAVRAGRVLTEMSSNEAKTFGIQEDRRRWYVRVDDGKGNMRPPAAHAKWLQRDSIDIGNGSIGPGDSVGVIAPWTPPDAWAGLSPTTAADILEEIDRGPNEGERYTAYKAGKRWAGQVIMKFCITKSEADAAIIIKEWVKNGVLIETEYLSPGSRKTVGGLEIDRSKMPGNATEGSGF